MIGISVATATTVGNQIRVVIAGSAMNFTSEDVLIPVPTIDGIDQSLVPTRHVVTLPGTFDGASGQAVVDFAPGQQRGLTLSKTMSQTEFKSSGLWSLQLDRSRVTYTSAASQAHSCPMRFANEPVIIFNTGGPESIATLVG